MGCYESREGMTEEEFAIKISELHLNFFETSVRDIEF